MSKVIQGKKLMLFVGVTSDGKVAKTKELATSYKAIALATNHTLSMTASTTDLSVKTKDDANGKSWTDVEINQMSWNLSTESLLGLDKNGGLSGVELLKVYKAGDPVFCKFGATDNVGAGGLDGRTYEGADDSNPHNVADTFPVMSGMGYITSLSISASLEDNATYSCEITGAGELEIDGE